jgi:hypothetical protein
MYHVLHIQYEGPMRTIQYGPRESVHSYLSLFSLEDKIQNYVGSKVLQKYYKRTTNVLQKYYKSTTKVLQKYYKSTTKHVDS